MPIPRRPSRRRRRRSRPALALAATLLVAACGSGDAGSTDESGSGRTGTVVDPSVVDSSVVDPSVVDPEPVADVTTESAERPADDTVRYVYPPPPESPPADESDEAASDAIDRIVRGLSNTQQLDAGALGDLTSTGDARHAWFVSDLLRFFGGPEADRLVETFETITGVSIDDDPELELSPWSSVTNHLIAWDTPDYTGYREDKGAIFTQIEDGWQPFFDDADADIDWRWLSWGGVLIDDRPLDDREGCPGGCIPALDDPPTTDADGGDWYPDDRTVFGIVVGDEALAIPLNIAEVHEMFNLSLGDRRLAIPYCTLCGSAQAYFTDAADGGPTAGAEEVPVVRTSGLLSRSNKVMYDLLTSSVFDTFTGAAVSGPLQDAEVVLEETTVVRSTWAEWKAEHPDTQIVAEDGGIERDYPLDPLGGRDDDGPIFPIGDVDPRLGVQDSVLGVVLEDGTTVAFPAGEATDAIGLGEPVELGGVELRTSGSGLVAFDAATGAEVAAHEAFWFAWSQFHPDTLLWERP